MLFLYILPIFVVKIFGAPNPTEIYANKIILVEPDVYNLYWNYTETDILFELHVKNLGWNAFGLSPTGGMANSDVIVTWVNPDGTFHFTDRHILSDGTVKVDSNQDWFPLLVKQVEGYTVSKFTRKIKLCDESKEDSDISEGTPFVIFSWNPKLEGNDIGYHGRDKRGQRTVPLISSLNLKIELDETKLESKEFRVNVMTRLFIILYFFKITLKTHLLDNVLTSSPISVLSEIP